MQQIDLFKNYLNNHYNFRFNEICSKVEFKPISKSIYKSMTDRDLNSLLIEMIHHDCKIKSLDLKTIIESDFVPIFNPIKDYFKSLPQLTGNENIKKLFKTIDTHDNEFFKWAFTKWIVAMIGGMIDENITNQQCIILSGNQGIGTSTWVRNLLPIELKTYYYEGDIKIGSNDSLNFISSKCLINLDELAGMTFNKAKELKELITKSAIELRKAYAHLSEAYMRRASFIGSVNGSQFLFDLTGNRRFLSFDVVEFENRGRHNVDMNLVFAEAYQLYKSGFRYWFDGEDQDRVEKNNESFVVHSPDEVALLKKFSTIPLQERNLRLYQYYYETEQYPREPEWHYHDRMKKIREKVSNCLNFLFNSIKH